MSEEVEVHVRQIDDTDENTPPTPMAELLRRMLLASIGAVAMTYDEAEKVIQRMVERGELAQKDGEKVMNEVMERLRQRPKEMEAEATETGEELGQKFESSIDQFLNRLNIPSKRDIDDLSAKVAQLAARLEELRREQTGATQKAASSQPTTPPTSSGKK
jgi:poly(hydroxyalkanoate) granule-associated protein